jgi:hypothetical protein
MATVAPNGRTPVIRTTGDTSLFRINTAATSTTIAAATTVDQFWFSPVFINRSRDKRPAKPQTEADKMFRRGEVRRSPRQPAKRPDHIPAIKIDEMLISALLNSVQ